jgi:death-on-curing family protein
MTIFSYEDILAINKRICERENEEFLVINKSNILSALSVQFSYYESDEEIRVALFHHLIIAHGFKDANKRTALVVLLYDGDISATQKELEDITLEIASSGGSHIDIKSLIPRIFKKEGITN